MLKGIPKCISPELLKFLCEMGHGDSIVIADGNFPAESIGKKVVRMDAIGGEEMLKAVLQLIPLDSYSKENFILMSVCDGDPIPEIWKPYGKIGEQDPNYRRGFLSRFDFYEEAKKAYCVIATGEEAVYANIILKKGVIK